MSSIIDDLYQTICRIEKDGGDPDDQNTWDRYYADTQPRKLTRVHCAIRGCRRYIVGYLTQGSGGGAFYDKEWNYLADLRNQVYHCSDHANEKKVALDIPVILSAFAEEIDQDDPDRDAHDYWPRQ